MPEPALLAHDLVRVLGGRRVLDGVCLTAAPGRRIGLIGENGVGKSTLLRLLAGTDRPDSGHVVRPADLGVLHQELPYDPASTLADVLDGALREARAALTELDRLTGLLETTPQDTPEYADLLTAYGRQLENAERQEVWEADRRAAAVLAGLGLGALDHGRSLASLSGGQRRRLALAALLVRRPSALLLDEPTNHLDDEAAAFLEERLRELPGTVVAASHDRAFLDAVCTDLIDLDPAPGGPVRHGGTYTSYLAGRRAERARWERRYAEEQEELALLRRAADTSGGRAVPGRDRPDNEKMGYGHRAGRAQTQLARRARDAHRRLEAAERRQVAPPRRCSACASPDRPPRRHRTRRTARWWPCATCGCPVGSPFPGWTWPPVTGCWSPAATAPASPRCWPSSRAASTPAASCGTAPVCGSACWHRTPGSGARNAPRGPSTPKPSAPNGPKPYRCRSSACWPPPTSAGRSRSCPSASGDGSPWPCWSPVPRNCSCWTSRPTTSRRA